MSDAEFALLVARAVLATSRRCTASVYDVGESEYAPCGRIATCGHLDGIHRCDEHGGGLPPLPLEAGVDELQALHDAVFDLDEQSAKESKAP